MLTKLCARCKKVILYPNRYCDKCKPIMEQQREESIKDGNKRYNKERNKKYTQFYNSKPWRILSKKYLNEHYLCEECQDKAKQDNKHTVNLSEETHHKKPIQTEEGWLRRLDWSNLIALCTECHNEKHNRFKKRKKEF